jgi:hypothetical protein
MNRFNGKMQITVHCECVYWETVSGISSWRYGPPFLREIALVLLFWGCGCGNGNGKDIVDAWDYAFYVINFK